MPKVSIIVPVYNTEKYLAQCLDSIINQSLKTLRFCVLMMVQQILHRRF